MKELYSALVKAQSQIKNAVKDSTNPHYRSKYADLESVWDAIREALHQNGLAVLQLTDIDPSGAPVLITRVIHTSGEHVEGRYPLVCKDPTDAQKLGSSTSYARRYALSAMLGVVQADQDDDGNAASGITTQKAPPSVAKPSPAPTPAKASSNSITDVFAAHKLEYPKALEDYIGKPVKEWNDGEKVSARQAVEALKSGKPWSQIVKDKVFS
jgi:hypothetical protein